MMKRRMLSIVIVGLFLLLSLPAFGGVAVTLDALDPAIKDSNPWFTVTTGHTRRGNHHDHRHAVKTRVIEDV
jgi:hypothetical protein